MLLTSSIYNSRIRWGIQFANHLNVIKNLHVFFESKALFFNYLLARGIFLIYQNILILINKPESCNSMSHLYHFFLTKVNDYVVSVFDQPRGLNYKLSKHTW